MPVTNIGLDLGTSSIIVYVRGRGILYQEPSLIAYDRDAQQVVGFGAEAAQHLVRAQGNIVGIRPLKDGEISDFVLTERLLSYFIRKSIGYRSLLKPRICIALPSTVTGIEQRAVEEAAYRAGGREVVLVREPIAAALGAGLDIMRPSGTLLVNVGGDLTEIAVLTVGGIAAEQTLHVAGRSFDEAIRRYLRDTRGLIVGEMTAEEIKLRLYSVVGSEDEMPVNGRDAASGVPRRETVTAEEVGRAVAGPVRQILSGVRGVIEKTAPDLAYDVAERGMILTGGGAMLAGLEKALKKETGITAMLADRPQLCAALGTGAYIHAYAQMDKKGYV